jgi:hypothetical protein
VRILGLDPWSVVTTWTCGWTPGLTSHTVDAVDKYYLFILTRSEGSMTRGTDHREEPVTCKLLTSSRRPHLTSTCAVNIQFGTYT